MISISSDLTNRTPDVSLGILVYAVPGPIESGGVIEVVDQAIAEAQDALGNDKPSALPPIEATRVAFKALGKDPSRYRPSSEALLRRVASGKGLYQVNDVVDLNNVISMHTQLPIGTYDLDKVEPPITFRRGQAGESYLGIGRYDLNLDGLPVFADIHGPFGTPFSDSDRTKVTPDTRRVLSVLISFEAERDLSVDLDYAARLLTTHAKAEIEVQQIIVGTSVKNTKTVIPDGDHKGA